MAAPTVHTLEETIKRIQAAQAPQQEYLDSLVAQNETSGTAQVQGIDAAKTAAFGGIAQAATNKGMTFSGFTPNEQAGYTGSTYLPALAKLQEAITGTRNSLFGKKTDLTVQGNTAALDVQRGEQSALDAWNQEQEKMARELEAARVAREFQASEAAKDRQLSASNSARSSASSSAKVPTLTKNAQGGYSVSDGLDLAGYARATGANLIDLLRNGDAKDRQAANWYLEKINKWGGGSEADGYANATKFMEELKRDRPSAFYRGG